MKKIGFIDYYISEWHANNYPGWIKNVCEKKGLDYNVEYVYAELDKSPIDGVTTKEWCEKYNAKQCTSIEELCEKSDLIIILAPDNPEKHLSFAKIALKYKKPTYIDKTFAPNLKEAKEIFEIAKKYGTVMFSSSALRCAKDVVRFKGKAEGVITSGGGRSLDIYIIHQLEMLVSMLGVGAKRVMATMAGGNSVIAVEYDGSKSAALCYSPNMPFTIAVKTKDEDFYSPVTDDFFAVLIEEILNMSETKNAYVESGETLEIIALRDACLEAVKTPFEFVNIAR